MFDIKNIIVTTDLSKLSFTAFEYAAGIAKQYSAKIHLVYVLEKIPPFLAIRSFDVTEDQVMESMKNEAMEQLKKASSKLSSESSLEVVPILRGGTDYDEIVKYSKEIDSDLIIITTHGRTGILHTLLGSVAEKVIRYAKCPVLVITPEDKEN